MTRKVIIFLSVMVLAGCTTSVDKFGRALIVSDNEHPFHTEALDDRKRDKIFKFKAGKVSKNKLVRWVVTSTKVSIESAYRDRKIPDPIVERSKFNNTVKLINEYAAVNKLTDRSSFRLKETDTGILIQFVGGEYFENRAGEAIQEAEFKITQSQKSGYIYFVVSYPEEFRYRKGNIGLQSVSHPIFQTKDLKEEIDYVFSFINISAYSYLASNLVEGEFNSNYPDNAVYANYKRKMILGTNDKSIRKSGYFKMAMDRVIVGVPISVYPYRNGSKVIYSAEMKRNFSLSTDGRDSFENFPSKTSFQNVLIAIANE